MHVLRSLGTYEPPIRELTPKEVCYWYLIV